MKDIGLDVGSSNIKIVAINEDNTIYHKVILHKMPIENALAEFMKESGISNDEVTQVVVTGIGQKEIAEKINGIKAVKVEEFIAATKGSQYLTNIDEALVISIGTGTAFLKINKDEFKHIGGTGIGGGTLITLCKRFAHLKDFNDIAERIKDADISKVDLRLKDIQKEAINSLLPLDITVANFGKLEDDASDNDIILGVVNMIAETIGMMGVFTAQNMEKKDIIVIGSITELEYLKKVFKMLSDLQNVNFIIPKYSEWAVAIGAVQEVKSN